MFSLRGLDVIKERALQSLQEQLDQVGLKNDYINKQVNKCASDVQLSEFLELVSEVRREGDHTVLADYGTHCLCICIPTPPY